MNIKSDIKPFKMYGNLYFVGSTRVSVHIIETTKGLIMIDTGYPEMYEQILDSMKTLGLDPENICAIFHSHAHYDHIGNTCRFKELSNAKTYISRKDNEIVNGTYELSWAKELGYETLPPFECDVLIEDGDCFTFGNTTVRCKLTPGHTDGTLSFFINLEDDKDSIIAAMHGGVGTNSMAAGFLNRYNLSFDCREKFREGLHKLAKEHVDLVMGNHPDQNDTEGKLAKLMAGAQSIVDPTEWQSFLITAEKNLDRRIESECTINK